MTYTYERQYRTGGDGKFYVETAPDRDKLPPQCQACRQWRINCAEGHEFEPEFCKEKSTLDTAPSPDVG